MNFFRIFLSAFLLGICFSSFSQSPVAISYNSENGLGANMTYTVFIDSRGLVWVGTEGAGVAMFDGQTIRLFSQKDGLCGNTILSIREDKAGKMWFGSQGYGLSIFDGKNFINYAAEDSVGLNDNAVMSLHCSEAGDMYVGTYRNGIRKFDNGRFVGVGDTSLLPMTVWHFIENDNGTIYFSTTRHGIGKLDGNTMTFLDDSAGVPKAMSLGLAFDLNGDILLGTSTGLYRIRDEKVIQHYTDSQGFYPTATTNDIRSLFVRKNGEVLMGFYSNFWIMRDEMLKKNYKTTNLSSSPTYMVEDFRDQVWMATEANGLVNFKNNGITAASNPNFGEVFLASTESKDSVVYLATNKAVYYLKKGRVSPVVEFETFKMNDVVEIVVVDTSDILLFSMDHGVMRCFEVNEKWQYEQASTVQLFFAHPLTDSLYCGTAGGSTLYTFNIYTHETNEVFEASTESFHLGIIYAIKVHPQTKHIWVGTYDSNTIIELTESDTVVYTAEDGIPNGALVDFAFDKNGACWFLNMDGAFGYLKDGRFESFDPLVFTSSDGLIFDKNGNLWIENSFGVLLVEIDNYQITNWRQFNKYDGVPESRGLIGNIYRLSDDRIILSKFEDNCYIIEPDLIQPDTEKPRIYIKGVSGKDHAELDSTWYLETTGFFHTPVNLVLPYSHNNLTIDLGAVYFSQPDSLRFSYVLEGFNDEWSQLQSNATITFTNLENGDYVFKCKAVGANKNESEILSFTFTVSTPWFKTWWFYVGLILVSLLLIYFFVKWRLSRLEKEKLRLQSIVDERTREVVLEKEKVEEKNREILDSINYAKRIQAAILPPSKLVKEHLPESFVLYQPKDIVAGDFYWLSVFEKHPDLVLFAAADCTGHGVPGAMVSVVCNNGLNRSVREYELTDPGKILDKTREIVISEFEKSEDEVKDGMDISLCAFNRKTKRLDWAGANNPLWIVQTRNGETNLVEVKPDKQPIGKYSNQKQFTSHTMQLATGDLIYIFTDGLQDQFGGEKGKKFKASSFKELILQIHNLPVEAQKLQIQKVFDLWKGSFEQLDDICIIAVRIV